MAHILTTNILPLFLFANFSIFDVRALTKVNIRVPEVVRRGDSATLSCDYDLESAALYTTKWYKDDEEFYRYVPKESPPTQVFALPHLSVDVGRSNSKDVTLTDVVRETSGEYKCEITADAPLFHTDIRSAKLLVADVPEDGPVLRTEVQKVAPGAKVRANCTTPGSFPRMNITWLVNEKELHPSHGVHIENRILRFEALPGLETVLSSLSLRATPELFEGGKLRLRCSASMFHVYAGTKTAEVQEDAPQLALIMVSTANPSQGTSFHSKHVVCHLRISALLFFVHIRAWLRNS